MSDENTNLVANQAEEKGDFAKLLKKFFTSIPKAGELVKGKVISIDNGAVRVDVEGVTIGVVRGPELFTESEEYRNIKVGEEVEATVIEQENEQGEVELSFREAGHKRVWDRMRRYSQEDKVLEAKVVGANKGGLMIKADAITAFMPVSQLSPENYPRVPGGDKNRILEHLRSMVGQALRVKVIDVNEKEEKLIVSEKAVWEDDQKNILDSYKIGDIVEGKISALTSFGAFLRFGDGLEGLIHISEIAWQRIDHPRSILKVGDMVKAQIIDLNKSKIYLSIKRLVSDPWKSVKEKYSIGQMVSGTVHKVEPFGLMVRLDEDIHGLAHVSELAAGSITEKEMREQFVIGEDYQFEIVNIESANHRLGLRMAGLKKEKPTKASVAKVESDTETPKLKEDVDSDVEASSEKIDDPDTSDKKE